MAQRILRIVFLKVWSLGHQLSVSRGNLLEMQYLVPPPTPLCCSAAESCPTVCNPMNCSAPGFLSFTVSWSLLKLMSIELVMLSNHLTLCCPFFPCYQSFTASGLFQWVCSSHQVAKVLKLQLHHQLLQWIFRYSALISSRIDWFNLLAVQGLSRIFSRTRVHLDFIN